MMEFSWWASCNFRLLDVGPGFGDPCSAGAPKGHNSSNFLTKAENFDINDYSRFELEPSVMWL
ncbi:hypothetical protein NSND_61518 [Nitrospira sp. ND1]|nr:hypothetical protein NSND_61518 [Nitrospira sp. ND1]